ncbi:MAG: CaiB/BaiF CoA-transferase family protein [Chloroflexota bacterium]|jgi:formyl-CoA transferase
MIQQNGAALDGVRVLDFSRVLAGPLCTMQLGDLGAEVIKVERPGSGDDTRHWGPPWHGETPDVQSAYFLSVNRNKRSLTLNLSTREGQELARRLAAQSQVVVENFMRGQMAQFGLDYERLKASNPGLVYCSITGFGQTGPYADRPGYDFVIQAMSGLMSITGPIEGPPYKTGVAISDVIAGLFATTAILAALRHSEQTGAGQYIDIALLDTQMAALVNVVSDHLVSGQTPRRYGNQHPNIVPYQTFRASDGEFVIAVGNDGQFAKLCALLDRADLSSDPRFATNPARVHYREALVPEMQAIFAQRTVGEWIEALQAAEIPCGPINDLPTALTDRQVAARGLIHAQDDLRLIASPLKLSETPATVGRLPPRLGEHTHEILRDLLGLADDTIARYRSDGVV